jgi:hypothetical protein
MQAWAGDIGCLFLSGREDLDADVLGVDVRQLFAVAAIVTV